MSKFMMRGPRAPRPLTRGPHVPSIAPNMHPVGPSGPMSPPEQMRSFPPMRPMAQTLPQGMGIPYAAQTPNVVFQVGMHGPGMSPDPAVSVRGGGVPLAGTGCSVRAFQPVPQVFPVEPVTNPVAMAVAACQPTTMVSVGIPDSMVGAILGKGGATINELQSLSGARITVSHRDSLMPGSENRILTITGLPMATQVRRKGLNS